MNSAEGVKNAIEPIDLEVIWERHSQIIETIECDMRGEVSLMKKGDFMRAAGDLLAIAKPKS